jgi:hypothetical protein
MKRVDVYVSLPPHMSYAAVSSDCVPFPSAARLPVCRSVGDLSPHHYCAHSFLGQLEYPQRLHVVNPSH